MKNRVFLTALVIISLVSVPVFVSCPMDVMDNDSKSIRITGIPGFYTAWVGTFSSLDIANMDYDELNFASQKFTEPPTEGMEAVGAGSSSYSSSGTEVYLALFNKDSAAWKENGGYYVMLVNNGYMPQVYVYTNGEELDYTSEETLNRSLKKLNFSGKTVKVPFDKFRLAYEERW